MKKYIISFLLILFGVSLVSPAFAVVKTTPTPTADVSQEIYNELQSRIASRVAQLNLVQKKGIMGTVTDISNTQMSITDVNDNSKFIDVDELTKFVSSSDKSFGISDIHKGDVIGVLGLYNKQSRRILARFITIIKMPLIFNGVVTGIDRKNYTLQVVTNDNKQVSIDVESVTKTSSYSNGTSAKSGFSKIATNQRITVAGFYDVKDSSKIIASRIIIFPDLPVNPIIDLQKFGIYDTSVTPSTGSGNKLVPIVK